MGTIRRTSTRRVILAVGALASTLTARADELSVTVREIPAHRVAFLEHAGPYWTIGATLRGVFERAPEDDRPVSFFARFASSPLASRSAALRAEVGYTIAPQRMEDSPTSVAESTAARGLQITERDAELAACVEFEFGHAPRAQDYVQLRQWIVRNGYRSVGPVTEVYTFPGSPTGEDSATPRVELQMSIRPANDPRENVPRTAAKVTIETAQATPTPSRDNDAETVPANGPQVPAAVISHSEAEVAVAPNDGQATKRPEAAARPTDEPSAPPSEPAVDVRCATFVEDFTAGVDGLAPEIRTWLGAAVLRMDAIARSLRETEAQPDRFVVCLSAVSERFLRAFPHAAVPVSIAAPLTTEGDGVRSQGRKAILRELDLLMMLLAAGRADTKQVEAELAGLFDRVRTILVQERTAVAPEDGSHR